MPISRLSNFSQQNFILGERRGGNSLNNSVYQSVKKLVNFYVLKGGSLQLRPGTNFFVRNVVNYDESMFGEIKDFYKLQDHFLVRTTDKVYFIGVNDNGEAGISLLTFHPYKSIRHYINIVAEGESLEEKEEVLYKLGEKFRFYERMENAITEDHSSIIQLYPYKNGYLGLPKKGLPYFIYYRKPDLSDPFIATEPYFFDHHSPTKFDSIVRAFPIKNKPEPFDDVNYTTDRKLITDADIKLHIGQNDIIQGSCIAYLNYDTRKIPYSEQCKGLLDIRKVALADYLGRPIYFNVLPNNPFPVNRDISYRIRPSTETEEVDPPESPTEGEEQTPTTETTQQVTLERHGSWDESDTYTGILEKLNTQAEVSGFSYTPEIASRDALPTSTKADLIRELLYGRRYMIIPHTIHIPDEFKNKDFLPCQDVITNEPEEVPPSARLGENLGRPERLNVYDTTLTQFGGIDLLTGADTVSKYPFYLYSHVIKSLKARFQRKDADGTIYIGSSTHRLGNSTVTNFNKPTQEEGDDFKLNYRVFVHGSRRIDFYGIFATRFTRTFFSTDGFGWGVLTVETLLGPDSGQFLEFRLNDASYSSQIIEENRFNVYDKTLVATQGKNATTLLGKALNTNDSNLVGLTFTTKLTRRTKSILGEDGIRRNYTYDSIFSKFHDLTPEQIEAKSITELNDDFSFHAIYKGDYKKTISTEKVLKQTCAIFYFLNSNIQKKHPFRGFFGSYLTSNRGQQISEAHERFERKIFRTVLGVDYQIYKPDREGGISLVNNSITADIRDYVFFSQTLVGHHSTKRTATNYTYNEVLYNPILGKLTSTGIDNTIPPGFTRVRVDDPYLKLNTILDPADTDALYLSKGSYQLGDLRAFNYYRDPPLGSYSQENIKQLDLMINRTNDLYDSSSNPELSSIELLYRLFIVALKDMNPINERATDSGGMLTNNYKYSNAQLLKVMPFVGGGRGVAGKKARLHFTLSIIDELYRRSLTFVPTGAQGLPRVPDTQNAFVTKLTYDSTTDASKFPPSDSSYNFSFPNGTFYAHGDIKVARRPTISFQYTPKMIIRNDPPGTGTIRGYVYDKWLVRIEDWDIIDEGKPRASKLRYSIDQGSGVFGPWVEIDIVDHLSRAPSRFISTYTNRNYDIVPSQRYYEFSNGIDTNVIQDSTMEGTKLFTGVTSRYIRFNVLFEDGSTYYNQPFLPSGLIPSPLIHYTSPPPPTISYTASNNITNFNVLDWFPEFNAFIGDGFATPDPNKIRMRVSILFGYSTISNAEIYKPNERNQSITTSGRLLDATSFHRIQEDLRFDDYYGDSETTYNLEGSDKQFTVTYSTLTSGGSGMDDFSPPIRVVAQLLRPIDVHKIDGQIPSSEINPVGALNSWIMYVDSNTTLGRRESFNFNPYYILFIDDEDGEEQEVTVPGKVIFMKKVGTVPGEGSDAPYSVFLQPLSTSFFNNFYSLTFGSPLRGLAYFTLTDPVTGEIVFRRGGAEAPDGGLEQRERMNVNGEFIPKVYAKCFLFEIGAPSVGKVGNFVTIGGNDFDNKQTVVNEAYAGWTDNLSSISSLNNNPVVMEGDNVHFIYDNEAKANNYVRILNGLPSDEIKDLILKSGYVPGVFQSNNQDVIRKYIEQNERINTFDGPQSLTVQGYLDAERISDRSIYRRQVISPQTGKVKIKGAVSKFDGSSLFVTTDMGMFDVSYLDPINLVYRQHFVYDVFVFNNKLVFLTPDSLISVSVQSRERLGFKNTYSGQYQYHMLKDVQDMIYDDERQLYLMRRNDGRIVVATDFDEDVLGFATWDFIDSSNIASNDIDHQTSNVRMKKLLSKDNKLYALCVYDHRNVGDTNSLRKIGIIEFNNDYRSDVDERKYTGQLETNPFNVESLNGDVGIYKGLIKLLDVDYENLNNLNVYFLSDSHLNRNKPYQYIKSVADNVIFEVPPPLEQLYPYVRGYNAKLLLETTTTSSSPIKKPIIHSFRMRGTLDGI